MLFVGTSQAAKNEFEMRYLEQFGWHLQVLAIFASCLALQPSLQSNIRDVVHSYFWRSIRQVTLTVQHHAAGLQNLIVNVHWLFQAQFTWVFFKLLKWIRQELFSDPVELKFLVWVQLAESPIYHSQGLRVHKFIVNWASLDGHGNIFLTLFRQPILF